MNLNEVRFGEVIFNDAQGLYGRVLGYKEMASKIYLLVTGFDGGWDPQNCRRQNEREKGNDRSPASPHLPDAEPLEREV